VNAIGEVVREEVEARAGTSLAIPDVGGGDAAAADQGGLTVMPVRARSAPPSRMVLHQRDL
jgi:hypothetical protein